jgi:tRNA pseudouridine38-40 synthase
MQQRFFIYLSYDGTAYHGWQVQPNGISVQEVVQRALSTLLRDVTPIVGAGRTDAGVHAKLMVAHFDSERVTDVVWLADKMNRLLPRDVAVERIVPVNREAHARFDAIARTYYYYVHTGKKIFGERYYSYGLYRKPDFEKMNEAAKILLETSDFTSFSKLHTDVATNICDVRCARWVPLEEPDAWRFEITANRFLRNMVRSVVGTLLDVGYGKLDIPAFREVIEKKNRCSAGESVPGNALFLVDIQYPDKTFTI